ncbi:F5/8 type C domain protein [compost metagenome]
MNKSASTDSSQSSNPVESGNDGSTATRWCANDGNTGHSWTVDLGSSMNIGGGTQVMWEKSGVVYKYKIETSTDNINWALQVDKTSNSSTDQIQKDLFYDVARYVRITVTGLAPGAWASFYDFKVFGEASNLVLDKSASSDSALITNPASKGNDGNATSYWSAADTNTGHWWMVDLGSTRNINYGTQVMWPSSGVVYKYKIETSTDNANWTLKVDKTNNTGMDQVQNDYFTGTARYVRITVTGLPNGTSASFYDFKVFGDLNNVALNKNSSADSEQEANPSAQVNDGNATTGWVAADSNTGHWWMVDLGSIVSITDGTQVTWPISEYYKYKIEISTDNVNWTEKVAKTGNVRSNQVQEDYFTGVARYVRITVTGLPSGAAAAINDFKVFGDASNQALYKSASADSVQTANPAANGNDGNNGTRFCANNSSTGHWWVVDLGTSLNITDGTQIIWEKSGVVYKYKIETSDDNVNWTLKVDKTNNSSMEQSQTDSFTDTARYVRITVTGLPSGMWASFYEFKVLGQQI